MIFPRSLAKPGPKTALWERLGKEKFVDGDSDVMELNSLGSDVDPGMYLLHCWSLLVI